MDDLISRQAAIDALERIFDRCEEIEAHLPKGDPDRVGYKMYHDWLTVWKYLHQLPSAQPDLSEYSDKLWRNAYERGKRDAQPEQRWIPCSEKPDTDRNVFVARGTSENMSVCVGHYEHDLKQWYEDRNWFAKCLYDGLYWCEMPPLPAPYQGEGEEE